jgi:hypothetical protein
MGTSGYDIIGDIHGHGVELEALLRKLEYRPINGAYKHPSRQALFLGDLIDRGGENKKVVDIVHRMIQAGNAQCIMGNHEYNSIAYHSKKDDGHWVRQRSEKNIKQHAEFTSEFSSRNQIELDACLAFFKSLPLFLDLGEIRLIHACWHDKHLAQLTPYLDSQNRLTESAIAEGHTKGAVTFETTDVLLKGHEIQLPKGLAFTDKDGNTRDKMRTKWWLNNPKDLREYSLIPNVISAEHSDLGVSAKDIIGYAEDAPPLFIGHYWNKGKPAPLAPNVACIDYSMGKGRAAGGNLVAYSWDGGKSLSKTKFTKLFD